MLIKSTQFDKFGHMHTILPQSFLVSLCSPSHPGSFLDRDVWVTGGQEPPVNGSTPPPWVCVSSAGSPDARLGKTSQAILGFSAQPEDNLLVEACLIPSLCLQNFPFCRVLASFSPVPSDP